MSSTDFDLLAFLKSQETDSTMNAKKDPQSVFDTRAVAVERTGDKLILPGNPVPMSYAKGREILERVEKDENQEFAVSETIDAFVLDGAVAFWKALVKKFGFASPIPTKTMFGPKPPQMITVQTGPDPKDAILVPWGQMVIPTFDKPVQTDVVQNENGFPMFYVSGTLKRIHSTMLKEVVDLAREIVRDESIYRGKAFELPVDSDGDMHPMASPKFMATAHIREEELILNRDIQNQVEVNLWTPIRKTMACIKHGVPLKRGILLEGPYGTGKSLTATATARICEENGWTFILLPHLAGLETTLRLARRYAPAVVFAEDIDRLLDERDDAANDLINTIDGVISKDMQVITVLTTNFAEKIERVMLRPGRLDAVITYSPPDAEAVQRLIRLYARDTLAEGANLDAIGAMLDGEIPATIREVVERGKLGMIAREETTLIEDDFVVAAMAMQKHLSLLKSEKEDKREDAAGRFADALIDLVGEASGKDDITGGIRGNASRLSSARSERRNIASGIEQQASERHAEVGEKLNQVDEKVDRLARRIGA